MTTFTPPKGFFMPESVATGEPFEMVCTLTVNKDGKISLNKIGDLDMDGEKPNNQKEDYSQSIPQDTDDLNNFGGNQQ